MPKKAVFPKVGDRFGRLSFVADAGATPNKTRIWSLRCDCGVVRVTRADSVKQGKTLSCGCLQSDASRAANTINLSGRRFGRLVAGRQEARPGAGACWSCLCDCGRTKTVSAHALSRGATISCGCAMADRPGLMNRAWLDKNIARTQRRRALEREAGGTFTADQIAALYVKQRARCACCRASLKNGFHRDHRTALANGGSNDIGNMELLCGPCNLRKGAKDEIEWANQNGRLL